MARAESAAPAVARLSPREREVLGFIGQGLSNGEIGARMHFSVATAKDDVSAVLGKIGVANRVQAAVIAERAGLLCTGPHDGTEGIAPPRPAPPRRERTSLDPGPVV